MDFMKLPLNVKLRNKIVRIKKSNIHEEADENNDIPIPQYFR